MLESPFHNFSKYFAKETNVLVSVCLVWHWSLEEKFSVSSGWRNVMIQIV